MTGRYNQFNESEQLAQILQWDPDKIGSYEGGEKTIEPDRLLRIAKALACSCSILFIAPTGPVSARGKTSNNLLGEEGPVRL